MGRLVYERIEARLHINVGRRRKARVHINAVWFIVLSRLPEAL